MHPIEAESYRRMLAEVDFAAWAEPERTVVARMVHGTADPSFAETARIGELAVTAAVAAISGGAAVVTDAEMVRVGLVGRAGSRASCLLSRITEAPPGSTRSAAAIALAARLHPTGALWVIGNAPTALAELLRLHAQGDVEPASVVGLPVGYVGAAEAKEALWSGALRSVAVTNTGRRGGSAVAASAFNALARLAGGATS